MWAAGGKQLPKGALANHEKEKAPCDQKDIAVPYRVVLGKNLNESNTKLS